MTDIGKKELERAFDTLQRQAPDRIARAIAWLRDPKARWIRIPLGVLFIIGSFFSFLPVLGIEMLPIGLLLIAQDVPFLRKPVGRMMIWLERKWAAFRKRRQQHENLAGSHGSRNGHWHRQGLVQFRSRRLLPGRKPHSGRHRHRARQ